MEERMGHERGEPYDLNKKLACMILLKLSRLFPFCRGHSVYHSDLLQLADLQRIAKNSGYTLLVLTKVSIMMILQNAGVDVTQSLLEQRRKEVKLSQTSLIIVFGLSYEEHVRPFYSISQYSCSATESSGFLTSGNSYTREICTCPGQK